MAQNGGTVGAVLKARYGSDVRKVCVPQDRDISFNDLTMIMQRIFGIQPSTSVALKYKDKDGDLITIADDNDLMLALQTEEALSLVVLTESGHLGTFRRFEQELEGICASASALLEALRASGGFLSKPDGSPPADRETTPVTDDEHQSVTRFTSSESVTNQPSSHAQVTDRSCRLLSAGAQPSGCDDLASADIDCRDALRTDSFDEKSLSTKASGTVEQGLGEQQRAPEPHWTEQPAAAALSNGFPVADPFSDVRVGKPSVESFARNDSSSVAIQTGAPPLTSALHTGYVAQPTGRDGSVGLTASAMPTVGATSLDFQQQVSAIPERGTPVGSNSEVGHTAFYHTSTQVSQQVPQQAYHGRALAVSSAAPVVPQMAPQTQQGMYTPIVQTPQFPSGQFPSGPQSLITNSPAAPPQMPPNMMPVGMNGPQMSSVPQSSLNPVAAAAPFPGVLLRAPLMPPGLFPAQVGLTTSLPAGGTQFGDSVSAAAPAMTTPTFACHGDMHAPAYSNGAAAGPVSAQMSSTGSGFPSPALSSSNFSNAALPSLNTQPLGLPQQPSLPQQPGLPQQPNLPQQSGIPPQQASQFGQPPILPCGGANAVNPFSRRQYRCVRPAFAPTTTPFQ